MSLLDRVRVTFKYSALPLFLIPVIFGANVMKSGPMRSVPTLQEAESQFDSGHFTTTSKICAALVTGSVDKTSSEQAKLLLLACEVLNRKISGTSWQLKPGTTEDRKRLVLLIQQLTTKAAGTLAEKRMNSARWFAEAVLALEPEMNEDAQFDCRSILCRVALFRGGVHDAELLCVKRFDKSPLSALEASQLSNDCEQVLYLQRANPHELKRLAVRFMPWAPAVQYCRQLLFEFYTDRARRLIEDRRASEALECLQQAILYSQGQSRENIVGAILLVFDSMLTRHVDPNSLRTLYESIGEIPGSADRLITLASVQLAARDYQQLSATLKRLPPGAVNERGLRDLCVQYIDKLTVRQNYRAAVAALEAVHPMLSSIEEYRLVRAVYMSARKKSNSASGNELMTKLSTAFQRAGNAVDSFLINTKIDSADPRFLVALERMQDCYELLEWNSVLKISNYLLGVPDKSPNVLKRLYKTKIHTLLRLGRYREALSCLTQVCNSGVCTYLENRYCFGSIDYYFQNHGTLEERKLSRAAHEKCIADARESLSRARKQGLPLPEDAALAVASDDVNISCRYDEALQLIDVLQANITSCTDLQREELRVLQVGVLVHLRRFDEALETLVRQHKDGTLKPSRLTLEIGTLQQHYSTSPEKVQQLSRILKSVNSSTKSDPAK